MNNTQVSTHKHTNHEYSKKCSHETVQMENTVDALGELYLWFIFRLSASEHEQRELCCLFPLTHTNSLMGAISNMVCSVCVVLCIYTLYIVFVWIGVTRGRSCLHLYK